jgi:hypothetical protein
MFFTIQTFTISSTQQTPSIIENWRQLNNIDQTLYTSLLQKENYKSKITNGNRTDNNHLPLLSLLPCCKP